MTTNFNGFQVQIMDAKIIDYLLNPEHPDGGSKARFFLSHNCSISNFNKLKNIISAHLTQSTKIRTENSQYGIKLIAEGDIILPDSFKTNMISVWMLNEDRKIIKFVTCYPIK